MKLIDILKETITKNDISSVIKILKNFKIKDDLGQMMNLYIVDLLEKAIDEGLIKKISSQTNVSEDNVAKIVYAWSKKSYGVYPNNLTINKSSLPNLMTSKEKIFSDFFNKNKGKIYDVWIKSEDDDGRIEDMYYCILANSLDEVKTKVIKLIKQLTLKNKYTNFKLGKIRLEKDKNNFTNNINSKMLQTLTSDKIVFVSSGT
jgi:hypothetical protein